jgi:hypothetical protein
MTTGRPTCGSSRRAKPGNPRCTSTRRRRAPNLRTRKGKDGVLDWNATTRGWQAKAARKIGVDLASSFRRVSRLGSNGLRTTWHATGTHARGDHTRDTQGAGAMLTRRLDVDTRGPDRQPGPGSGPGERAARPGRS